MPPRKRTLSLAIVLTGLLLAAQFAPFAQAQISESSPFPFKMPPQRRTSIERREQKLEELFPKTDFELTPPTPVSLEGIRIPGLNQKGLENLGFNHFVVLNNTPYDRMSDLYRDNRLKNKSNFVTCDAVIHPYLGFNNAVLAAAIEESASRDLFKLLDALLKASIQDYRATEEADVKDDIQRNLAFISVAMRLLDPSVKLADMGGATDLADDELKLILAEKPAVSLIFNRSEDFGAYRPIGWYGHSERTRNFYRCCQWLSRMYFTLSNISIDTIAGGGNSFRRAALLYRALDQATVDKKPAPEAWGKLISFWTLLGASSQQQENNLLPPDFQTVFKEGVGNLRLTLNTLAQPLLRTKLLLSVKKQRPMEISARSVFELGDKGQERSNEMVFRLFPAIEPTELNWLKKRAHGYQEETAEVAANPLALFDLHAWGAPQATNVLNDISFKLEPTIARALPELEIAVRRKTQTGQLMPIADRRWQLLSSYFKPPSQGAQGAIKQSLWMTRNLESAFGGWIDTFLAIAPIEDPAAPKPAGGSATASTGATPALGTGSTKGTTATATTTTTTASPGPGAAQTTANATPATNTPNTRAIKPADFHYLEPSPDVFRKISAECKRLNEELTALGYYPKRYAQRSQDFVRLCDRLAVIADREIGGYPMDPNDFRLLRDIDMVLEKVDFPLPGFIYLDTSIAQRPSQATSVITTKSEATPAKIGGATIGIGRAGQLFVILNTNRGWTLGRGAVYTYYETAGGPFKQEHWTRKLNFGLLRPPSWASHFDVVVEGSPKTVGK